MARADLPLGWKVKAGIATLTIPPLIHLVPLHRLARWLGGRRKASTTRQGVEDRRAAEWVDGVLRRLPWPWRRTCLKRSAVLYHLLRCQGVPVELRIGVRRNETGHLAAHAWLTRGGISYLEFAGEGERSEPVADFTEIACFPEPRVGIR